MIVVINAIIGTTLSTDSKVINGVDVAVDVRSHVGYNVSIGGLIPQVEKFSLIIDYIKQVLKRLVISFS